jgi:hypothetical protein
LDRLNAVLQAGFDVKMRMGTPEQLAAGVSLLRPENAYLYGRIVAIGEERLRPLFTRVLSEGVAQGIFDTFDAEGVGDDPRPCAGHRNLDRRIRGCFSSHSTILNTCAGKSTWRPASSIL